MIDFRYHLVSLVSVFLALAIGIVLGRRPAQGVASATPSPARCRRCARTRTRCSRPSTTATPSPGGNATRSSPRSAPQLLRGQLADRSIAVITLPGAVRADVDRPARPADRRPRGPGDDHRRRASRAGPTRPRRTFRTELAGQPLTYLDPRRTPTPEPTASWRRCSAGRWSPTRAAASATRTRSAVAGRAWSADELVTVDEEVPARADLAVDRRRRRRTDAAGADDPTSGGQAAKASYAARSRSTPTRPRRRSPW